MKTYTKSRSKHYGIDYFKDYLGTSVIDYFKKIIPDITDEELLLVINKFYKKALYSVKHLQINYYEQDIQDNVYIVPGHFYSPKLYNYIDFYNKKIFVEPKDFDQYGPIMNPDNTIMILGKHIGEEDYRYKINFCGTVGYNTLQKIVNWKNNSTKYKDHAIYLANFIRWKLLINSDKAIKQFTKDCYPLIANEIYILKPKLIIYFHANPCTLLLKKLLNTDLKVGTISAYKFETPDGEICEGNILTTTFSKIAQLDLFLEEIEKTKISTNSNENNEIPIELLTIDKLRQLRNELVGKDTTIAVDCEWNGEIERSGAFLRSIQIATDDGTYVLLLTDETGQPLFTDIEIEEIRSLLKDIFLCPSITLAGSFFYTDAVWLRKFGIDLYPKFSKLPKEFIFSDVIKLKDIKVGVFDIAMASLALDEELSLDLCEIAKRTVGAARWDKDIVDWVKQHKKEQDGLSYGNAPTEMLVRYGGLDVYYTLKSYHVLKDLLYKDKKELNSWGAFISTSRMCCAILDMMYYGVRISLDLWNELRLNFKKAYNRLVDEVREKIKWPAFDPRKMDHLRIALYGREFDVEGILPPEAQVENLKPIKLTDKTLNKRFKGWDTLDEKTKKLVGVSVDKETCGILSASSQLAKDISNIKIVDHAIKNTLSEKWERFIQDDGRVRSFVSPTLKTGRCRSSRPNMQNFSKRRDEEFKNLCKIDTTLRSIIIPAEGYSLVECDFASAELFVLGVMSGEDLLIEHCRRSALPDNHPDYYDIHSNLACKAFKLDCPPTKEALKKLGKAHLRTIAKSLIYGINYGRGISTICKQIKSEEHIEINEDDAIKLKDIIMESYPKIADLQEVLMNVPIHPGYQINYFGRIKHFRKAYDEETLHKYQRESLNYPFQSMVADCLNLFTFYLQKIAVKEFKEDELQLRILLPLHDALLIEVKSEYADLVANELIPEVAKKVTFKQWNIYGQAMSDKEYHLDMVSKILK